MSKIILDKFTVKKKHFHADYIEMSSILQKKDIVSAQNSRTTVLGFEYYCFFLKDVLGKNCVSVGNMQLHISDLT